MTKISSTVKVQRQTVVKLKAATADTSQSGVESAFLRSAVSSRTTTSIKELNHRIHDLEQNGEESNEQLDALRIQRDNQISVLTGALDVSDYDVTIAARAQTNGTSYNRAIELDNALTRINNQFSPPSEQRPLMERVQNLPWETTKVSARIDELMQEGLRFEPAVVLAMTERQNIYSPFARETPLGYENQSGFFDFGQKNPVLHGESFDIFAGMVSRSGNALEAWALRNPDATFTFTGADDQVTVKKVAGLIEVSDGSMTRTIDPAAVDQIVINTGSGNDRIIIDDSVTEDLMIMGGAGDDYIYGGGNGNHTLIGGAGNDTIRGGNGTDIIIGGTGRDNLHGGYGGDIMSGGDGDDHISGGLGNDIVFGGNGIDVLNTGHGQDILQQHASNEYNTGDDDLAKLQRLEINQIMLSAMDAGASVGNSSGLRELELTEKSREITEEPEDRERYLSVKSDRGIALDELNMAGSANTPSSIVILFHEPALPAQQDNRSRSENAQRDRAITV